MTKSTSVINGVIYTSVFNPNDGRKNWEDMVTAFCYAFKKQQQATLLLKFVGTQSEQAEQQLLGLLHKLSPFDCRVVASNTFLSADDYLQLIYQSAYYVNTSHGEGQCLPLMEFMSCGVPAIAPNSSAMADYMDEDVGFVIESSPELSHWQHDARRRFRTHQQRLNWQSLADAYVQSFEVKINQEQRYQQFCDNAKARMEKHCSIARVSGELASFIEEVIHKPGLS